MAERLEQRRLLDAAALTEVVDVAQAEQECDRIDVVELEFSREQIEEELRFEWELVVNSPTPDLSDVPANPVGAEFDLRVAGTDSESPAKASVEQSTTIADSNAGYDRTLTVELPTEI